MRRYERRLSYAVLTPASLRASGSGSGGGSDGGGGGGGEESLIMMTSDNSDEGELL